MRHFILPALFLLSLSSCSTYQYITLDSPQLPKNDKNQLTFENDTLRLTYNFTGKGGPLNVKIYNKTDQPLYVNWKKSALIRDERSTSLYNNYIMVSGAASAASYRIGKYAASRTNIAATVALPEGMDFIPPSSAISKDLLNLERTGILSAEVPDTLQEKKIRETDGMQLAAYKQLHYAEDQSPFHFKSYITFSIGNNNPQEFTETTSFYVGEVCQTHSAPELFPLYRQQGDQLYIKVSSDIPGRPSDPAR